MAAMKKIKLWHVAVVVLVLLVLGLVWYFASKKKAAPANHVLDPANSAGVAALFDAMNPGLIQ